MERRVYTQEGASVRERDKKIIESFFFFLILFISCRVKVQAFSNASGSPVDEKVLLQVSADFVSHPRYANINRENNTRKMQGIRLAFRLPLVPHPRYFATVHKFVLQNFTELVTFAH